MKRFGLIGYPLSHTFSPAWFKQKFESEGISATYEKIELQSIVNLRSKVFALKLNGFNVTIPHKTDVIKQLDELSEACAQIGAVNCVNVVGNKLVGYNTDVYGFEQLLQCATTDRTMRDAIVLGSGGASKAVQYVLNQKRIDFQVVSRNGRLNYQNLHPSQLRNVQLIINCTPLGMHPKVGFYPDIPYEAISSQHVAIDLIYNPEESEFLKRCKLSGALVFNGLIMLHGQAEKSREIWGI